MTKANVLEHIIFLNIHKLRLSVFFKIIFFSTVVRVKFKEK